MASVGSEELANSYKGRVSAMSEKPDMSVEELRHLFGHWGGVSVDPSGADAMAIMALASLFIGEKGGPKNPLANLPYADYSKFPPVYMVVGDAETPLDDSRRMAERAKEAGGEVRIDIFPDMQHVCRFLAGTAPEADDAVKRMARWGRSKLDLN